MMKICSFDLKCIHGNGLQNPLTVFIAFKRDCASFSIFKQYFESSMGSKKKPNNKFIDKTWKQWPFFLLKSVIFYFHFSAYMIT